MFKQLKKLARSPQNTPRYFKRYMYVGGDIKKYSKCAKDKLRGDRKNEAYVIADGLHYSPTYPTNHGLVASYMAESLDAEPILFLRHQYDRKMRSIGNAFSDNPFILNDWVPNKKTYQTRQDAKKCFDQIKNEDDVLQITYENIHVGDLIYNTYLSTSGEGTVSNINDDELYGAIYDQFHIINHLSDIFDRYNIKSVVVGHQMYSTGGGLARVALSNNVTAYHASGHPEMYITKITSLEEVKQHYQRPSQDLFDLIKFHYIDEAIDKTDEYMQAKVSDEVSDRNVAYSKNKEFLTKSEMMDKYNLDNNKPTATILPHVWIDHVHYGDMLYRDYLTWFRKTLGHIVNDTSTNWLIKPHPHRNMYDCNQTVEDEVEKKLTDRLNSTVTVLSEDINVRSLIETSDVVITARGTAGLEFPIFGVPSIITATSRYSGFGFTIEPESKSEYKNLLNNINDINPVDEEGMINAKIIMYILKFAILNESTAKPQFGPDDSEAEQWKKLGDRMCEYEPDEDPLKKGIFDFVQNDHKHLLPEEYRANLPS